MKKLLVFFLLSSAAYYTQAQEVEFKINVPLNKAYQQISVIKTDVEGEQSLIMDMNIKGTISGTKKEAGNYFFESITDAIKMDMDAGMMTMSYDSENPSDDEMSKMLGSELSKLVGKKTLMTMSDKGKLIKLEMPEGISEQAAGSMESMGMTASYPDRAVKPGDTWDSEATTDQVIVKSSNKYIEKNADGYIIESTGDVLSLDGQKVGTFVSSYTLDADTHFTKKAIMKMNMNAEGQKVSMDYNITISPKN